MIKPTLISFSSVRTQCFSHQLPSAPLMIPSLRLPGNYSVRSYASPSLKTTPSPRHARFSSSLNLVPHRYQPFPHHACIVPIEASLSLCSAFPVSLAPNHGCVDTLRSRHAGTGHSEPQERLNRHHSALPPTLSS